MGSCKASIALLKTKHIIVGACLFKQFDLLADKLEACEHFNELHAVLFCDRRCHVRGHNRGDKRRILRHGSCRLALSQNILCNQHTRHIACKRLVLPALGIQCVNAKSVRIRVCGKHDVCIFFFRKF